MKKKTIHPAKKNNESDTKETLKIKKSDLKSIAPNKKLEKKQGGSIEKELKSIYQNNQGKMPEMDKLDVKKNSILKKILYVFIPLLVVISILAWAGFLYFQPNPNFTGEKVLLEIKAPFNVTSGEQITAEIKITNKEQTAIMNNYITVRMPLGFIVSSSSHTPILDPEQETPDEDEETPEYTNIRTWKIEDILPYQSETITLEGTLVGTKDSSQTMTATLNYMPSNFSSEFQETASFTTEIGDTYIDIESDAPSHVTADNQGDYTVTIKNTSDTQALSDVVFKIAYPESFTVGEYSIAIMQDGQTIGLTGGTSSQEPQQMVRITNSSLNVRQGPGTNTSIIESVAFADEFPFIEQNPEGTWYKMRLVDGSEGWVYASYAELTTSDPVAETNTTEASSPIEEVSEKEWKITELPPLSNIEFIFIGTFNITENKTEEFEATLEVKGPADDYYVQKQHTFSTDVIKGDLLTTLIVQGSKDNKPLDFGQTIHILITVQNKSSNTMGDLNVRAVMNSPVLDWGTISDDNQGTVDVPQVQWNMEQIPGLGLLLPEDEVSISYSIKTKKFSNIDQSLDADDITLKSFFDVQINQIGDLDTTKTIESNTIINEFNSNAVLSSEARYFDSNSNALGSGPLPPVVGQKTTYAIIWTLSNSFHELKDIEIRASLPENVTYEQDTMASTGSIFTDSENQVKWQIGRLPSSAHTEQVKFKVSITPGDEDIGKILSLLSQTTLSATDVKTKGTISRVTSGLTTQLDDDPVGKDKGLVQESE